MHYTVIAETVGTSERSVRRYLERFKAGPGSGSSNATNGAAPSHNGGLPPR
jgi:hypothetical protein